MSLCDAGRSFVETARLNLATQLDSTITTIQSELFPQAQFANPSVVTTMRQGPLGQVTVPADVRVVELQEADLLQLVPGYQPGTLRGVYNPALGKILLNNKLWCTSTIIHETLHAVSTFSVRNDLGRKLLPLVEGLTEFYTGYLLFKAFPNCYATCWRNDSVCGCQCTYGPQVKIWSSLCHFLPIKETCGIYFWDDSRDWESKWTSFIRRIRESGHPTFKDVLQNSRTLGWALFRQECMNNFGSDYKKIYESDERSLDLSGIVV